MKRCLVFLLIALLIPVQALAASSNTTPMIPLAEQLYSATVSGAEYVEESGMACVEYSPANSDDLNYLFTLCAACGAYRFEMSKDSGQQEQRYALIVPGTDYSAYAVFDPVEAFVMFFFPDGANVLEGDNLEKLLDELGKTPRLPSGGGSNVLPQFYACVDRQPSWSGLEGELSYAFDGQMCWTELYDDIDDNKLSAYAIKMLQFGCDLWCDIVQTDANECFDPCLLHFSNGDAEVILNYSAARQSVAVHYKPGVSYNLLDARQIAEAFG